ncbi:DUF6414 family protein [Dictyobacter formicarum]|uniref:Uncharacterized protein n=1 Tax=Dictyobacter formicarum TaxID=2778368 RepID=A0ABQ3VRH0_9CHLR|nr:hypothetical protein [Dictyobacter formicarum]GHO88309.1 hypothetical protein KSZ_63150 [Dictyobacter formicarum]
MAKLILRHFFYLNESIVDDYLSQLEGGLQEGPYTTKEVKSGNKGGSAGTKYFIEANINAGSSTSSETTQTIRETPTAKFNRMYSLLQENEEEIIHPLSGFDQAVYDQIEPAEIVEVRGIAKLPQWEKIAKAVNDTSGLLDIMKALGQDPFADPGALEAYQGITGIMNSKSQDDTVLIIAPIGSPKFKFVTKLEASYIRSKKEEFETEVTILGKVTRRLAKGEKIDIFSVLPDVDALQNLNRAQRRQAGKNKTSTETPLDEKVGYPAIQIQPIAIYQ